MESTKKSTSIASNRSPKTLDPELDIRSERFNPLKALYSKDIQIPENSTQYDNIAQFESVVIKKKSNDPVRYCNLTLLL